MSEPKNVFLALDKQESASFYVLSVSKRLKITTYSPEQNNVPVRPKKTPKSSFLLWIKNHKTRTTHVQNIFSAQFDNMVLHFYKKIFCNI